MDQYITGTAIRNLREQRKITQLQLAEILGSVIRRFPSGRPERVIRTSLSWNP